VTPPLSEVGAALCLLFILLVPFALAGLALINTGLIRSRSAAHSMLASLCVFSVAVIVYFVCGHAWQGYAGFLRGLELDGSPASLAACLQMLALGLAALIPLGAAAERWRLGASCASTALLAGVIWPLFAHWTSSGWLAQLGARYALGHGYLDAGGAGFIHGVGGLTALSLVWILGPRRGKYTLDGMPAAIPGHSAVLVLFGCLLALAGWLGLNCAGTILLTGASPGVAARVIINTILAAASAALTSVAITRVRFGKPDASLTANGWVGGLVAGSAACAFAKPPEAVIIGLVAGALVPFSVEWLELHFGIDDPGGAISVHAVAGLWGVLAAGLFAPYPGQWLAQVIGIATLLGFVLPLAYGSNWLLNRFLPQRAAVEGERQGLDLYELGAGAYPEFLTHSEEFTQR
jgi:Amt family ammonium transporter